MKKRLSEGFINNSTPDMKYYAFDWDDNIADMPTKIILKDNEGNEVPMSTDDYATYRKDIGKENFEYNGTTIVGYANDPFRNFTEQGDSDFIVDSMSAKPGPAFDDFREAINGGSIFAIITARGHDPKTIKKAIYNYIVSDYEGIDKESLFKNLKKYRKFVDEEDMNDLELLNYYMDLNRYYPVSFRDEKSAKNPEEGKIRAMEDFISYIREMSAVLNKKAYLKNDISNNFIPKPFSIGFSDDDMRNIEKMKSHFDDKRKADIKMYATTGGAKRKI